MTSTDIVQDLLPDREDLLYEEELLRNPYSLKMWWRYLEDRKGSPLKKRFLLYERALAALPGSYKLWYNYLRERQVAVRGLPVDDLSQTALTNTYERALAHMNKMPRIWLMYIAFLEQQFDITRVRRTCDKALMALPIMQHERIWQVYLKFITRSEVPVDTASRVYRRYLILVPEHVEEYIAYLQAKERWGEAAQRLSDVVNDDTFKSVQHKSKLDLWLELCTMVTRHPEHCRGIRVDAILRGGIRKFAHEVSRLWIALAEYYINRLRFHRARDVLEEAVTSVLTVRDFTAVFDFYLEFEEQVVEARMEEFPADEDGEGEEGEEGGDPEEFLLKWAGNDTDLRLARLEHLIARRPLLASSVELRQNPHNVFNWHKRVKLLQGNASRQIYTYTEAVKTVDPHQAVGKPHTLWTAFARLYERHGDLPNARQVLGKAVAAKFRYVDDLASVWCEWAEMELRHKNYRSALDVMRRAVREASDARSTARGEEVPVQSRVWQSLKLWSLLADLEESFGSVEDTSQVYDKVMELRLMTPQMVLNYAEMLRENKYFERSFQVYERGISLFKYPHVAPIWQAYLKHFTMRYGDTKLERLRDLFEQSLLTCPSTSAKGVYLELACVEEKYGLARRAMDVYERAVKHVPQEERLEVYDIYVARAREFYGIQKVREVYELAIDSSSDAALSDADFRVMCVRYAKLEQSLGEIDRARAIYVHASAVANPGSEVDFWEEWNQFEVQHGNEDTYREMLRIKRSVTAAYAQLHFNTTTVAAVPGFTPTQPKDMAAVEQQALQQQAAKPSRLIGFVSGGTMGQGVQQEGGSEARVAAAAAGVAPVLGANAEEIDLDDLDEPPTAEVHVGGVQGTRDVDDRPSGGGAGDADDIVTMPVPQAVLAQAGVKTKATEEAVGAMERIKRKKMAES